MQVKGQARSSDSYATMLLAEESTHKLSASTNLKQRLALTPALDRHGEYRATFDAGLAVAMTSTINLTVGFNANHNSDPGEGRKATDTLLTTGVSMKFE
jgi:putative salt-induced outer membrane protein YdiY